VVFVIGYLYLISLILIFYKNPGQGGIDAKIDPFPLPGSAISEICLYFEVLKKCGFLNV
jgi:hypothetical protein